MENASKALIIAGSVLIVILLIAIGMKVFNSTSNVQDDVVQVGDTMSSEIADVKINMLLNSEDMKNDKWFYDYIKANYIDKNLSATQTKELCKLVILRLEKLTGNVWERNKMHISSMNNPNRISMKSTLEEVLKSIDDNKRYKAVFSKRAVEYEDSILITCLEK